MGEKEDVSCEVCKEKPVKVEVRQGLSDYWLKLLPLLKQQNIQSYCQLCLHDKVKYAITEYEFKYFEGKIKNHANDFASNTGQLVEGIDYYQEGRFFVFTSWYHLKRGYCCGSGCRHCPYTKKKNNT